MAIVLPNRTTLPADGGPGLLQIAESLIVDGSVTIEPRSIPSHRQLPFTIPTWKQLSFQARRNRENKGSQAIEREKP